MQTARQYIYMHIVPQSTDFVKMFFYFNYNILIASGYARQTNHIS